MKALPKAQPSIYDLLQPGSYQRLKSAFSQFDINVDPRSLILNNQTKESVLSQILSDLEHNPKLVNLATVTQESFNQKEIQEYLSEEKSIQDNKIFSFLRCLQMYFLTQEAAQIYFKMEQLKVLLQELHSLLVKLASAEYERQVQIAEAEKIRILEAEKALKEAFSSIFNNTFESCFDQLSEIKGRIQEYNNTLRDIKAQNQAIKKEMREDSLLNAKELKQSCPELDNFSEKEVADMDYKYRKQLNKVEITKNRYEQKNEELRKLNQDIDKELSILNQKQGELDKEKRNARYRYGGALVATNHDKQIRIPESMHLDFEQRQEDIQATRQLLLEKKNANLLSIEKKHKKIENLERDPDKILRDLLAQQENPDLRAAFEKDNVREKLIAMHEKPSIVDEKFQENRKDKVGVIIKIKHDVNMAAAAAAAQIDRANKCHALENGHPSHEAAQAAARANELHDMVKAIKSAAAETISKENTKYKEQKCAARPT